MAVLTSVNIWVRMTKQIREALDRAIGRPYSYAPGAREPVTEESTEYARLSYLLPQTRQMLHNAESGVMEELTPKGQTGTTYSLYLDDVSLPEVIKVCEDLEDVERRHYPDFELLGSWYTWRGEPVGGVGSPRTRTPSGYKRDFILRFGQPARKFV